MLLSERPYLSATGGVLGDLQVIHLAQNSALSSELQSQKWEQSRLMAARSTPNQVLLLGLSQVISCVVWNHVRACDVLASRTAALLETSLASSGARENAIQFQMSDLIGK